MADNDKHFVLVHGLGHGAWCWYKVKPRLESLGHRVTALDLAASGINMKPIQDVRSFHEYTKPLLELLASLPPNEKVILVGHSLGGMNLALAMDEFPHKISVGVFLAAFMPDTTHHPSYVIDKFFAEYPQDMWVDTRIVTDSHDEQPLTIVVWGPKFLPSNAYQQSPVEDLELARTLARPGSTFVEDLSKMKNFSEKGYGSVTRVFVACTEDRAILYEKTQRWMIQNYPPRDWFEIKGADHMAMFSKTQEVCDCLVGIANKYA
ncbi:hypothetical protein PTKIN_Ptkin08bG0170800 [Pterospermum kingtungense]